MVKLSQIKKKYKDKKTGEYKEIVINLAKVKDRIKQFWEDNPKGKIDTTSVKEGDQRIFKCSIEVDQSDPYSRKSTGHSMGSVGGEKDFEKLETVAVGRALALIGYAGDGEIASTEEMEEYMKDKTQKKKDDIEDAIDKMNMCKTLDELKDVYRSFGGNLGAEKAVFDHKEKLKVELSATPKKK